MADDKVTLTIELDSKDAQAAVELFGNSVKNSVKKSEQGLGKLTSAFKGAGSELSKGNLSGAMSSLGSPAVLGALAAAAGAFKLFSSAIGEATEAERETKKLALAIASTGEFSKEALGGLTDFADEISDLTGISGDTIKGQLALAKSFGITNEQAKNLVKGAANLSAITGQDLESSVRQLGGTFDGTVGKIGNLGAGFRNLTAEQLENGAAIDLINKQYDGAAETLGTGFEGSINKLKETFANSIEDIGKLITEDKSILFGLNQIKESIKSLAPVFLFVVDTFLKGFKTIGAAVAGVTGVITGGLAGIADLVGLDGFAEKLDTVQDRSFSLSKSLLGLQDDAVDAAIGTGKLDATLNKLNESAKGSAKAISGSAKKALEELKKLRDEAQKFITGLIGSTGTEVDKAAKKAADAFSKIDDLVKKGLITNEQAEQGRLAVASEVSESIIKITEAQYKAQEEQAEKAAAAALKAAEDAKAQITRISGSPLAFFSEDTSKSKGAGIAFGVGITDSLLKGAAGASKLIATGVGAAADAFIPGIGGAVASLFETLALGPDAVKGLVKGFVDAIPDIIIAVADSIPVVVEALIQSLLFDGGLERIAKALIKAMINLSLELGYKIAVGFIESLVAAGPAIGGQISEGFKQGIAAAGGVLSTALQKAFTFIAEPFKGFKDTFANLVKPLVDGFKSLIAAFQPIVSALNSVKEALDNAAGAFGKGGGKGIIGEGIDKISEAVGGGVAGGIAAGIATGGGSVIAGAIGGGGGFGFASGGIVPGSGNSDSVPAMLTPGELVVPNDLVGSLGAFLSGQGGGSDSAILMAILQAVQQPMVVNAEAKVNQSAFANIVLQLNRQNARLTA